MNDASGSIAPADGPGGGSAESKAVAVPGGATWSEAPGLVARGFCMGTADVIPGVSGGTMALILGIYARLIDAIKSFGGEAAAHLARLRVGALLETVHWRFLGAVVVGQGLGIVTFTKVLPLPVWLEVYPEQVFALFFGLILGSILLLGRDVARRGVDARLAAAAAAGVAAGLAVTGLEAQATPSTPEFVFLCGTIAICAMILPGISGSFILLILGQYAHVLGGVGTAIHPESGLAADRVTALTTIVLPFAAGAATGIVLFSRLLSWILRRAQRATLAFMTGLLAGSLRVVWPFQERIYEEVRGKRKLIGSEGLTLPRDWDGGTWLAVGLGVAGFALVFVLDRVARARVSEEPGLAPDRARAGGPEGPGAGGRPDDG